MNVVFWKGLWLKLRPVRQYATIELEPENVRVSLCVCVSLKVLENGSKDFSDIAYTVGGL